MAEEKGRGQRCEKGSYLKTEKHNTKMQGKGLVRQIPCIYRSVHNHGNDVIPDISDASQTNCMILKGRWDNLKIFPQRDINRGDSLVHHVICHSSRKTGIEAILAPMVFNRPVGAANAIQSGGFAHAQSVLRFVR